MSHRDVVIRTTRSDDWQAVRALRLEMLRDYPLAYGETLEHALTVDEAGWRSRAERGTTHGQTSVVAIDGERWVGHMGGYVPAAATGPLLVGVYVARTHRGDAAGVSRLLLEAVEDWARGFGDTLRLEVHEDNPRARRFYERFGFLLDGNSRTQPVGPGYEHLPPIKHVRYTYYS